jgi:apolipoprotein N-acyltransferase
MNAFREIIFTRHPNVVFPILSAGLAIVALSPTPSFIPLVFLVATLLTFTRIVAPRPHAIMTIFWAIMGVSFGSTISHIMPSIDALSSAASSIASLLLISSLSSSVAILAILSDRLSPRLSIPWARVTFFPAVWATVWQIVSHASPVGHLVTWTPVAGIAGYEWMRPLVGPWGINWLVGAYAMVIAEQVGVWFIGPVDEFEPDGPLIPSLDSNSEPRPTKPATSQAHHTLFLSAALLALTVPSFFLPALPILPWSTSSTPLSIGCVLPHPLLPGDRSSPLDRFIAESKHHTGARILLWPEGALRFETSVQREEALKRVQGEIKGPLIGVTFTELVPHDAGSGWEHAREGKWRNGLVLVGPDGHVAEFYKRNLVPSMSINHRIPVAPTQPV